MKKEWISCNACGADQHRPLSACGEWQIGECRECGLVYLNPAPFFEPDQEFSAMSKGFQYTRYMHEAITPRIFAHEREQFLLQLAEIERLTGAPLGRLRYLEVGCGSGAAVRVAADLGWEAVGIDIDPELIETGIAQHGADLRCMPLREAGFADGSFDFIRLRDVIEHLPDPFESLLEIRRLLRPSGVALFVTPNEGGALNQARLILGCRREKIAWAEPPHHIHGFTPATLERILRRAGFRVLEMHTTTPIDPAYVTSNNIRSADRHLLACLWRGAQALGRGNFLVGWVQKDEPLH